MAIRCAQLSDDGRVARLHAGGGIVADSDPLAELAETQAKFQAMLSRSSAPSQRFPQAMSVRVNLACGKHSITMGLWNEPSRPTG